MRTHLDSINLDLTVAIFIFSAFPLPLLIDFFQETFSKG
jgi:hypothetical protein